MSALLSESMAGLALLLGLLLVAQSLGAPLSPNLISSTYDAGNGGLTLFFDTLVNAETLNFSRLSLQSSRDISLSHDRAIILSDVYNSLRSQGNTTALKIILKSTDFAKVILSGIGKSLNTTYVALAHGAVLSNMSVESTAVPQNNAMMMSTYHVDTLPPFFGFYHLDTDLGLCNITFSEPIDQESFSILGLVFQRSGNMKVAPAHLRQNCRLSDTNARISAVTNYNRTVVVSLGYDNMNCIKEQVGLCISRDSCHLSAYAPFVNDTSGNPISLVAFDSMHGVQPKNYVPDFTAPTLLFWDFDLSRASFALVFSEPVDTAFFNFSGITLTNGVDISFRVDSPLNTTDAPSHLIRFTLSTTQYHWLQHFDNFFKSSTNAFLALDQGIVVDTSFYQHKYASGTATLANPLRVRIFVADVVPPELVAFDLDALEGLLTLYFSETVLLSSLAVEGLTFQSAQNEVIGTEVLEFAASDVSSVTVADSDTVVLALGPTAKAKLAACLYFGKSAAYTFIAVRRTFITDKAAVPNVIVEISTAVALRASVVVPDRSPPTLLSWVADMNENAVTLSFSKPIAVDSVVLSAGFLASDPWSLTSTRELSLADTSVDDSSVATTTLHLKILQTGQVYMKSSEDFCTGLGNCYLTFSSLLANSAELHNVEGITTTPVTAVTALPCTTFVTDAVAPVLREFQLDMGTATMLLNFSKPVRSTSIDLSALQLVTTDSSNSAISVALSPYSTVDQAVDQLVTVRLSAADLVRVQRVPPLALNSSRSTVLIAALFAADVFGNYVTPVAVPKQPSRFVADTTAPRLVSVYLDPVAQQAITLTFSEVVDPASLNTSCVAIASRAGATLNLRTATVVSGSPSEQVEVSIAPMKTYLTLKGAAISQSDTFVFISAPGCVVDVSPHRSPIASMGFSEALRDGLRLLSFRLDLQGGTLDLEMSFFVAITQVIASRIIIQQVPSSSGKFTLSGMTAFQVLSTGPVLRIYLTALDVQQMQRTLAFRSRRSVFLSVEKEAVTDSNGKRLSADQVLECAALVVDYGNPSMVSYNLDLSAGYLDLQFSRDVVTSTFRMTGALSFASSSGQPAVLTPLYLRLASSNSVQSPSVKLDLNNGFPVTDRERILLAYPLAAASATTLLLVNKGAVLSNTIPPQSADLVAYLVPTVLTADTVPPRLIGFSMDLTRRQMTLNFSEAVRASSLSMGLFTILENPNDPDSAHVSLSSASVPQDGSLVSPTIVVALAAADVDAMMLQAPLLATAISNTFIACRPTAFADVATPANANEELYFRYGLRVQTFEPDAAPPRLIAFDFSLPDQTLDLQFDEVVDCESFAPTRVLFQSRQFMGAYSGEHLLLSASSVCVGTRYLRSLHILVGYDDIVRIKSTAVVLKAAGTTFLRLLGGAVEDAFRNANNEVMDGDSVPATLFVPDIVAPRLLGFAISNLRTLTLFFNEPMDVGSLKVTWVTLQDLVVSPSKAYRLIEARVVKVESSKMRIEMTLGADYDRIVTDSQVIAAQSSTFLAIASPAIRDMAGNAVVATVVDQAVNIGPAIVAWDLDLDQGAVIVQFSEEVALAFSMVGFTVRTALQSLALTTSQLATQVVPRLYRVSLSSSDLHTLQLSGMAAPSQHVMPLFLSVTAAVTLSIDSEALLPSLTSTVVRSADALQVRYFTADATAPQCSSFILDLNAGQLNLRVNEPVQVAGVRVADLTLFSSANGSHVTLTQATTITLASQTLLQISLSTDDLNRVKRAVRMGTSLDSLVILSGAMQDMAGNPYAGNSPDTPILIESFVPDTTPPMLVGFEVDLSTYLMVVVFDEAVDLTAFSATDFTLLDSSSVGVTPYSLQLSEYSLLSQSESSLNAVSLDLSFLRADQFALEAVDQMFNSAVDSFVAVAAGADLFGNAFVAVQVQQATQFSARLIRPALEAFELADVGGGNTQATVYFSSIMSVALFNCADLVLASAAAASPTFSVTFASSDCTVLTSSDERAMVFTFPTSKLSGTTIGQTSSTSFMLTVSSPASSDVYGNTLRALPAIDARAVGPWALRASLDLDTATVLLVFSKAMDFAATPTLSSIGFLSSAGSLPVTYYLQAAESALTSYAPSSTYSDTVARIALSVTDLNSIKALDMQFWTAFVLLEADAFSDGLAATVNPQTETNPLFISRLVQDHQRPRLLSVDVDMGKDTVTLVFNEPIRPGSLVPSGLTFQSTASASTPGCVSYRLTGGVLVLDVATVTLQLSHADAAGIKVTAGLMRGISSSFLSVIFGSLADFAGNTMDAISSLSARDVDSFIADTVKPVLQALELDLSGPGGQLVLSFSEPVQAAMLVPTSIVLQSRFASQDGSAFRLTGGTVLGGDSDVIAIDLLAADLLAMQLQAGLIRRKQSTYLVCGADLATDVAGNAMVPFVDLHAKTCDLYVPDATSPEIVSTALDFNLNRLTFTFDEPVNVSSVDASAVMVQPRRFAFDNDSVPNQYRLTGASKVITTPGHPLALQASIQLGQVDSDNLRVLPGLAKSRDSSFFAVGAELVVDFAGNAVAEVPPSSALLCATFVADTTPPLIMFVQLDMDRGRLALQLSEAVDMPTLRLAEAHLQDTTTARFGASLPLSASTAVQVVAANDTMLTITFSPELLAQLKAAGIGRDLVSSYLSWTGFFAHDYAGNALPPAYDASVHGYQPRTPDVLLVDLTAPSLRKWWVDRAAMRLHLVFDEPVVLRAPALLRLVSQDTNHLVFSVLGAITYGSLGLTAQVQLTNQCLGNITAHPPCTPNSAITLFTALLSVRTWGLSVSPNGTAATDKAALPNALPSTTVVLAYGVIADEPIPEGHPDCSSCAAGEFTSAACSSGSERQCQACSSCGAHHFQLQPCAGEQDTVCAACSTCPLGYFVSAPCTATSDTVCSECRTCGSMEYVSRSCAVGRDAICESCAVCDFDNDPFAAQQCRSHPQRLRWEREHCCALGGRQVLCKDLLNRDNAAKLLTVDISGTDSRDAPYSLTPRPR